MAEWDISGPSLGPEDGTLFGSPEEWSRSRPFISGTLLEKYAHIGKIADGTEIWLGDDGMSATIVGSRVVIRDGDNSPPAKHTVIPINEPQYLVGGKRSALRSDGLRVEMEHFDVSVLKEMGEGAEITTDRTFFAPPGARFDGDVKITAGNVIMGNTKGISCLTIGSTEKILSPVTTGDYVGKDEITTGGYIGIRGSEVREVAEDTTVIIKALNAKARIGTVKEKGEVQIVSDDIKHRGRAGITIVKLEEGAKLTVTPSETFDTALFIGEVSAGAIINKHKITQPEADAFNALGTEKVWVPDTRRANIFGIERVRDPVAEGLDVGGAEGFRVRGTASVNAPEREENNPLGAERKPIAVKDVRAGTKRMQLGGITIRKIDPKGLPTEVSDGPGNANCR